MKYATYGADFQCGAGDWVAKEQYMYNLFSLDMESEEEAVEKVRQMMSVKNGGPFSFSSHGKTVSVDINNPLVADMAKVIGIIFNALGSCINNRHFFQRIVRHV